MTPLERAARAIMKAQDCGLTRNGEHVFCDQCECMDIARAVLEELREPSHAMTEAGDAVVDEWPYGNTIATSELVEAYQAMIDQALKEG